MKVLTSRPYDRGQANPDRVQAVAKFADRPKVVIEPLSLNSVADAKPLIY